MWYHIVYTAVGASSSKVRVFISAVPCPPGLPELWAIPSLTAADPCAENRKGACERHVAFNLDTHNGALKSTATATMIKTNGAIIQHQVDYRFIPV